MVLRPSSEQLAAHSDYGWAGSSDRVPVIGNALQTGSASVLWKSLKQRCTALCSTKANYVSLSELDREVKWMRELLAELEAVQKSATKVCQNITGSIHWASIIGHFRYNKHIDVRFRHFRDLVKQGIIDVKFVEISRTLADNPTNPLHGPELKADVQRFGVVGQL